MLINLAALFLICQEAVEKKILCGAVAFLYWVSRVFVKLLRNLAPRKIRVY